MRMARKRANKVITAERALTVNLQEELQKAISGDKKAAQEVLEFIHDTLACSLPLTDGYRDYLLGALKAGSEGRSVDKALGLTRGGKSSTPSQGMVLVAYVVQDLMRQGETLDVAAEAAAPICNQVIEEAKAKPSAWSIFNGRPISSDQARKWYIEIIRAN